MSILNATPLIYAAQYDHIEVVQLLLAQPGIEITCKDIRIQILFIRFRVDLFMVFRLQMIYGISISLAI